MRDVVELLRPYPSDAMRIYRVSTVVNNVKNDGPECVEAAAGDVRAVEPSAGACPGRLRGGCGGHRGGGREGPLLRDGSAAERCLLRQGYPAETREAFCDGHLSAFAFFGGVPRSILYDNSKLAVARILGDGSRQRTRVFAELQSHYLFQDRFGRPGKGNDKGKVEGLIGYARRNFVVPIPRFANFQAFNAELERRCRRRLEGRLRGQTETIGERLVRDQAAFLTLPASAYDACDKRPGRVSSLSLVRYRTNDYSVPVAYSPSLARRPSIQSRSALATSLA